RAIPGSPCPCVPPTDSGSSCPTPSTTCRCSWYSPTPDKRQGRRGVPSPPNGYVRFLAAAVVAAAAAVVATAIAAATAVAAHVTATAAAAENEYQDDDPPAAATETIVTTTHNKSPHIRFPVQVPARTPHTTWSAAPESAPVPVSALYYVV